ncbi:MAG: hypothetical protein V3W41_22595 [Planctomycetota bacterium]
MTGHNPWVSMTPAQRMNTLCSSDIGLKIPASPSFVTSAAAANCEPPDEGLTAKKMMAMVAQFEHLPKTEVLVVVDDWDIDPVSVYDGNDKLLVIGHIDFLKLENAGLFAPSGGRQIGGIPWREVSRQDAIQRMAEAVTKASGLLKSPYDDWTPERVEAEIERLEKKLGITNE